MPCGGAGVRRRFFGHPDRGCVAEWIPCDACSGPPGRTATARVRCGRRARRGHPALRLSASQRRGNQLQDQASLGRRQLWRRQSASGVAGMLSGRHVPALVARVRSSSMEHEFVRIIHSSKTIDAYAFDATTDQDVDSCWNCPGRFAGKSLGARGSRVSGRMPDADHRARRGIPRLAHRPVSSVFGTATKKSKHARPYTEFPHQRRGPVCEGGMVCGRRIEARVGVLDSRHLPAGVQCWSAGCRFSRDQHFRCRSRWRPPTGFEHCNIRRNIRKPSPDGKTVSGFRSCCGTALRGCRNGISGCR